ncbi:MAG: aminodeoxychorismate synthase, component I, partial [Candidatus Omnitrophica bacterium]|nr:aminodeoxychorismate synthase, component I [Candidatus Omnitrophota bacterium]
SERFKIRKYETLFQMTSQINGKLRKGLTYFDIFKNIFPGGSVTGAPKIRTMQIIRKLEKSSRGVYCGALGFILKGKEAVFNLPIRTVCISGKRGQMGVGSGIVYDSSAFNEFKECELKARFLSGLCREFSLIETIGWERGFKFLKEHLERLKKSAEYFGFAFDSFTIANRLRKAERGLIKGKYYRIRLLLTKSGNLKIESKVIKLDQEAKYVAISGYKVNPNNIFLYHKTTNRDFYNNEFLRYKSLGYFDVIFLNTKEEVTEGAISNIVIEKNGRFYTPKLSCGLLPGLYREYLLRTDKVREKTITLPDLLAADRISLCNSVRGMTNVILA